MDQDAGRVAVVVGVPPDVLPPVYHHHPLVALAGYALRQHAPGEAGSDDEPIKHAAGSPPEAARAPGGPASRRHRRGAEPPPVPQGRHRAARAAWRPTSGPTTARPSARPRA